MSRMNSSALWDVFDKIKKSDKKARCRLCRDLYSYKGSTGNLKAHLKKKHHHAFIQVNAAQRQARSGSQEALSDDTCEELLKVTDVWSYFDTDSGTRAQCTVCHISVGNEYDELKAHLKDNHPKLLLQLLQNKDAESDEASNDGDDDDNENSYTEVVYLDQEPTENVPKHKEKPKSFPKPTKKRERPSLYSSGEIPLKKAKKEEESDELGSFVKYITCLLKKLPADVFSNVQIEIINTILKANSQASTTNTSTSIENKELINTSSDVIKPIHSSSTMMGHNYTITVGQPKKTETENGDYAD